MYVRQLCDEFFLETEFFEGIRRQNQESYFMFKYFFIEICIVYEIMWKNIVETNTEYDYIIQHMRFACCKIKLCTNNLLLFHVHNIYTTEPFYNGCKNTVSFDLVLQIVLLIYINYQIFTRNIKHTYIFNQICYHKIDSIPGITYSVVSLTTNILICVVFLTVSIWPMSTSSYHCRTLCIAKCTFVMNICKCGREYMKI